MTTLLLAEDLSEKQFWTRPHSYGNSFGNLVLHITGNLNYYIGAQIAQTGYIRQRDLEFTQIQVGQKQEVLTKLDEAVAIVVTSLRIQTDEAADYRLRWFTPTTEVPLCGHATLASAAVVMERLEEQRKTVVFQTLRGPLTVNRTNRGYVMSLRFCQPVLCAREGHSGGSRDWCGALYAGALLG